MSRDTIFSRIRQSQAQTKPRLRSPADHIIPARAQVTGEACKASFVSRLESHGVCVERLASTANVPSAVLRYLEAARLPLRLKTGRNVLLTSLPWSGLNLSEGAATGDDFAAISVALAGIAETGTLVLASGPDNPCTLAFLPDVHFILIFDADIVASMEQAFQRVVAISAAKPWPRAVNLISAASRTGDIGGQLVMGAHGPRQLVVLIVDEPISRGQ